jgi:hypothetical protein
MYVVCIYFPGTATAFFPEKVLIFTQMRTGAMRPVPVRS